MACLRFHSWKEADLGLELQTAEFTLNHNLAPVPTRGKTAKQEIKLLGLCLHTLTKAIREKQAIIR